MTMATLVEQIQRDYVENTPSVSALAAQGADRRQQA
jgi:hypothetical protein